MKRRMIAAGVCFGLLLPLSGMLAGNLDLLVTRGRTACTLRPAVLFPYLLTAPRALLLSLMFAALGVLGILWALFGNSHLDYRSGLYEAVPGLRLPRPEGQGQFGTAWWMEEREQHRHFPIVSLPSRLELPPELAEHYRTEKEAVANGKD